MSTKSKIFISVVVALIISTGFYYALTSSLCSKPEEQAPLIVGIDSDSPPFVYRDKSGELSGFNVELIREICKILNRDCQFKTFEVNEFANAVRNHEIDIALSELTYTPELMREFAFSMVYYRSRSFFITANSQVHDLTFANAKNLKIGVRSKSRQLRFVNETYAVKGSEIYVYPTYSEMVSALKSGEVNAILVGGVSGYMILASPMGRKLFAGGFPEITTQGLDESRISSRKSDEELIEKINQALLELHSNGKFHELTTRYLPNDHVSQLINPWTVTRE